MKITATHFTTDTAYIFEDVGHTSDLVWRSVNTINDCLITKTEMGGFVLEIDYKESDGRKGKYFYDYEDIIRWFKFHPLRISQ